MVNSGHNLVKPYNLTLYKRLLNNYMDFNFKTNAFLNICYKIEVLIQKWQAFTSIPVFKINLIIELVKILQ
jgi:hypothetical protein